MKANLLLIIIFLMLSCTPKKNDINSIELISYNWSTYNDTTRELAPLFFKCRMYANLNESGVTDMYVYRSYPTPKSYFFTVAIEKDLISQLISAIKTIDTNKLNILDAKPIMYDGPSLKLRINNLKKESKLFEFIDFDYGNEVDSLRKFYHYLFSKFSSDSLSTITDLENFKIIKSEFIKFCIKYDTTGYHKFPIPPTPPLNDTSLKYISPK